jgi:hypothetical protein
MLVDYRSRPTDRRLPEKEAYYSIQRSQRIQASHFQACDKSTRFKGRYTPLASTNVPFLAERIPLERYTFLVNYASY